MVTKCLLLEETGQQLKYTEQILIPENGQVPVKLKAAALNHRDVWISQGKYAKIQLPCIPGSDGCGTYDGKDIVILPAIKWGTDPDVQSKEYQLLGMPGNGTFASHIYVYPEQIFSKPDHLTPAEAAAVPLSGLTAWRALMTKGRPNKDDKVLISGIGGGVAMFAFQFALALGMDVYVTSGDNEKIEKAKVMGAKNGLLYSDPHFAKNLTALSGGFDIIIDGAGGDNFSQLLASCRPGARMVMYGGSLGTINNMSPQAIFWKQISILGTTMGTPEEFQSMLNFIEKNKIRPQVDSIFPLSSGNEAMDRMKSGAQFGKIVLEINAD